jgi:hypothetical protein
MEPDLPQFNLGQLVYHRTEDTPGVVIGMVYRPGGSLLYQVAWQGRTTEDHYECELTSERPFFSSVDTKDD